MIPLTNILRLALFCYLLAASVSATRLQNEEPKQGPDDCDFDNYDEFCFWKNDPINDFDWLQGNGTTPTRATGPTADHSSGNGSYLYIEASSPAEPGYKARLISKRFRATPGRCLSFWYHMHGITMGELSVYLKTTTDGLKRLWHRSREQGNRWLHALVSLVSGTEYELVFEAVRGNAYKSDIAIDDIKFEEKLCMQPVGCFRDGVPHAFPRIIANLRNDIDWFHMDKTINECARIAYLKGYKMIGIQFYGECWSGNSSLVVHDAYGPGKSSQCWSGVGGPHVYYVYRLL